MTARRSDATELDWLPFHGEAEKTGSRMTLRASLGGGVLEMAAEDVRVNDGRVEVRNRAAAAVTEQPGFIEARSFLESLEPHVRRQLLSDCHRQDDCPSKCCACIGLVRVCCGEGGTRGICLGAWGCP